ncbi:MAG TPA: bifunctional riboflavin kinase/FAD synthetase [Candidatus Onthovivens sp.]|nr:bifunctional riboflavin kinase/FAD synthetase [Candidatus Onthovivens sp.]
MSENMEITYLNDYSDIIETKKKFALILGYFDGVHIGHVYLINSAKNMSNNELAILTFDKPLKKTNQCLTSLNRRLKRFEKLGISKVFILNTDNNLKNLSYGDFIEKILKKINPAEIFCGPDFKYGHQALGDVNYLKDQFNNVNVVNYLSNFDKSKISSSTIKLLIQNGEMEEAALLLGRQYRIEGVVCKGKGLGKKLGFPTANLKLNDDYVIPKCGVYITKTIINDEVYNSLTNIGTNPTVNENNNMTIETYILDFNRDIYDQEILIDFYKLLRCEIKFYSKEELIKAMENDEETARKYFL